MSLESSDQREIFRDAADDLAEIRYSLTALGEAYVAERDRTRFRGFGPCAVAKIGVAG